MVKDTEKSLRLKLGRYVIDKYNVKQAQLNSMEEIAVSRQTVNDWFNGRAVIPLGYAMVIADHYGFCVYEFYPVNNACKGSTITIRKGSGDSEPDFQYKPAKDWPKR